jgi:hypothetical protein
VLLLLLVVVLLLPDGIVLHAVMHLTCWLRG